MSNIIPLTTARRLPGITPVSARVKALDEMQGIFARRPLPAQAPAPAPIHEPVQVATPAPAKKPSVLIIIARGIKALRKLTPFMGVSQRKTVEIALRGEEGEWFMEKMEELAARVEAMPVTYGQDGKGDDAICYLHYFGGPYDGYITEKDMEEAENPAEAQWQAHGYVHWAQNSGHLSQGYICLPEILASNMELDFHFEPTTVREIKRKHGILVEESAAESCLNSDNDSEPTSEDDEPTFLPKPPDNAPADPVPGQLHIRIERAEGYTQECTTHHYSDFATAWACLQAHGHTAPDDGSYDKTDLAVTFPNGDRYVSRYDMTRGGYADADGLDLPAHILKDLRFYAGQWTPDWMIAKGRTNPYAEKPDAEAVDLLNKWSHILTLDTPACHAPAGVDGVTSDEDIAKTATILQEPHLTSEAQIPGSGWRVGAVLVETWGYEQTNKDFYQITERKGNWITLVPLDAIKTRHKDPSGTDAMRGTSMPGQSTQGAKPIRRKLDLDAHRPIAKGVHGYLQLWDGEPEQWTDYA